MDVIDEVFARFQIRMCFGGIWYIATAPLIFCELCWIKYHQLGSVKRGAFTVLVNFEIYLLPTYTKHAE